MKRCCSKTQSFLDLCWAVGFAAFLTAILYKCRFGYGDIDESFYLTIPYRLWMGDGLFIDEYHLSQMSSVLVYPIMKIYLWLAGTTEGMLLAFRYIFTVMHGLTALFIYLYLRRKNTGAIFASLIYLLFTPFGIMALSYNSMGLACMCISAVLIYGNAKDSRLVTLISGVAFSGAVLCCPYLLMVYVYYGVLVAVDCKNKRSLNTQMVKNFAYFSFACIVCAVLFLIFVFSRCSFTQLLKSIPWIFQDPEHPSKGFGQVVKSYFMVIAESNDVVFPVFLGTSLAIGYAAGFPKRKKYAPIFLLIGLGLTAVYLKPFVTEKPYLNFLMFPPVILGLFCFVLFPKENIKEFLVFYIPGLLYGLCMHWSSNQKFYVISNAALLSSIGSIMMFMNVRKKLMTISRDVITRVSCSGTVVMLTVFVVIVFSARYDLTFWDYKMSDKVMTEQIEVGVNKGIYTDEEKKMSYTKLYQETEPVRNYPGKSVLYFSDFTFLYLDDTKQNASFSAWISGAGDLSSDRLVYYYEINPDKIPDIMYCQKNAYDPNYSIVQFLLGLGYRIEENESSYLIMK